MKYLPAMVTGFWIREKDLLEKYLYGMEPQSFNPANSFEGQEGHFEEGRLPEIKDLEYPEDGGRFLETHNFSMSRMAGQEEVLSTENGTEDKASALSDGEGPCEEEEELSLEGADLEYPDDEEEGNLPVGEDLEYPEDQEKEASISSSPGKRLSESWRSFFTTFLLTILILVIILVIFAKVFKYPVLELIFPSVDAQENREKHSLDMNFQNISVNRGAEGFVMVEGTSQVPENCHQAKDFFTGVFMLLDRRNGSLARWNPFINRCSSVMPKDIKAILDLPEDIKPKQLQRHLKKWNISAKKRKQIAKIHRLVERQERDALTVDKFLAYRAEKKKIFLKLGIFWNSHPSFNPDSFRIS